MPSATTVFAVTVIILGALYQSYLSPLVEAVGVFRKVKPLNTEHCDVVEGIKACEKLVIHPSGLVYLACASSPRSRIIWMPTLENLNSSALRLLPSKDYIATYDPTDHKVNKLNVIGLNDPRGLNLHGMDVVTDKHDSKLLWLYLVNHRPPMHPKTDIAEEGADSVIEIFKTRLGSGSIEWVETVSDPGVIITPNDIVGGSNGKEFWFTNDHGSKVGLSRTLYVYLRIKSTSVGYCHVHSGCKIAADKLYSSNGIVRDKAGRIWVGSSVGAFITIYEHLANNTLSPIRVIKTGRAIDNLALASDGSVIAAAFPQAMQFTSAAVKDEKIPSPVSALRISEDVAKGYNVEKIYESDGVIMGSAATTASMYGDKLYLHGLMAHRMLVCTIPALSQDQK